jgi:hypothetical protein
VIDNAHASKHKATDVVQSNPEPLERESREFLEMLKTPELPKWQG